MICACDALHGIVIDGKTWEQRICVEQTLEETYGKSRAEAMTGDDTEVHNGHSWQREAGICAYTEHHTASQTGSERID